MAREKYLVKEHELLQTNDAAVWARAFMRVVLAKDTPSVIDEGFMIGWFANAMEAQRLAMLRGEDA
jgi:hypothetical protein